MTLPWPIQVTPLAPIACGSILWRQGGASGATIVLKATFGMMPEANARLVAPADIVREDRYRGHGGCLEEAGELAPYLPGAGVILSGAAHAPAGRPAPAVSVRLGLSRERPLVNKVLHIIGYRPREAPGSPHPFDSMPIVYERAFGGPGVDDNPVGTGAAPGSHLPNIVDPEGPHRPAGFGPVARHWGPRRRLLGACDPRALDLPVPEIPPGFDWAFFHAAPPDQRVDALRGEEWIVLDGLHPSLPHLQTRLPSVHAHARWHLAGAAGPGPSRALDLLADTLVILPETGVCSMIWRGHVMIEQADAARMQVVAGIDMTGYPLAAALAGGQDGAAPPASVRPGDARAAISFTSAPPGGGRDEPITYSDRIPTAKIKLEKPLPPVEDDEPDDPLARTERIVISKLKQPALPFSGGDAGAAKRGARPANTAGLPFKSSDSSPASAPFHAAPGGARSAAPEHAAGLPFKPPEPPITDEASETRMIDLRALEAKAIAPFAISSPGARPPAAPAAIPGAPWSAPRAARTPADADEHTSITMSPAFAAALPFTMGETPKPPPQAFLSAGGEAPPPAPPAPVPSPLPFGAAAVAAPPPPLFVGAPPLAPPAAVPPPPVPPSFVAEGSIAAPETLDLPAQARLRPAPLPVDDVTSEPATMPPPRPSGPGAEAAATEPRAAAEPAPPATMVAMGETPPARPVTMGETPKPPARPVTMGETPRPPARPEAAAVEAPAAATETASSPGAGPTGVAAMLVARLKAREPVLDLVLAGADLRELDLAGAVLSRMNLKGARLAGCKLAGARLSGAQLADVDLTGADLSNADLGAADLSRAVLVGARFDGAILTDGNLGGAQGTGASFASVAATRASFARGQWDEASFAQANAAGADFGAASLAGTRFPGATLSEASFDDARGAGAVFDEARLAQAHAVGAELRGASLRGVDAAGSSWERAVLDGASFAGAGLKEANLARASCLETSFAGADLTGANLQRLTGDGADLQDAKLGGADLRQAKLHRASFQRASLGDVSAGKADLAHCRFDRADLQGATLRGARLTGASLAHAQLDGADLRDADLEGANLFGASRKTAKLGAGARGFVEVDPGESQ